MNYCSRCVLPDSRPGIQIGPDGICSGCVGHSEKRAIDWEERKAYFEDIVADIKKRAKGYECIVPVSGGKDSTAQIIKCLDYGLKILAVSWITPAMTSIGARNLSNLIRLGVDHVGVTVNPEVERKFTYRALLEKGDPGIPMHMAIYSIPLRVAVSYGIPLVIWGESPHMEYGGSARQRKINSLDFNWLKVHGILQHTSAEDWVGSGLSLKDLEAYRLPRENEFRKKNIRSIFLGYYFKWDPEENLKLALRHGFSVRKEGPKTGYYNYADIDCDFISVHHHFKWLKFGFTRLFDNLSVEIRNGRLTRDQAIRIIKEKGDQTPHEDIDKMCKFLRIGISDFRKIEERFRNKTIWKKKNGKWIIEDFLINDWNYR